MQMHPSGGTASPRACRINFWRLAQRLSGNKDCPRLLLSRLINGKYCLEPPTLLTPTHLPRAGNVPELYHEIAGLGPGCQRKPDNNSIWLTQFPRILSDRGRIMRCLRTLKSSHCTASFSPLSSWKSKYSQCPQECIVSAGQPVPGLWTFAVVACNNFDLSGDFIKYFRVCAKLQNSLEENRWEAKKLF